MKIYDINDNQILFIDQKRLKIILYKIQKYIVFMSNSHKYYSLQSMYFLRGTSKNANHKCMFFEF